MIDLIAAEWRKTFSLRLWWIMLLIGVILAALSTLPYLLLSGFAAEEGIASLDLTQPEALTGMFAGIGAASVVALLIGILSFTGEYRHGTVTDTFLTEPRRWPVLVAKGVVAAAMGVLLALAATATVVLLALLFLPEPHAPISAPAVAGTALGVAIGYALYAVLGVAVGALIPNQLAAVMVGILWMLVVESLIGGLLPSVAPWLPSGAAQAIMGTSGVVSPAVGVVVLLGYSVALSVLAAATTLRRDIT